jgi:hypothetical protein
MEQSELDSGSVHDTDSVTVCLADDRIEAIQRGTRSVLLKIVSIHRGPLRRRHGRR